MQLAAIPIISLCDSVVARPSTSLVHTQWHFSHLSRWLQCVVEHALESLPLVAILKAPSQSFSLASCMQKYSLENLISGTRLLHTRLPSQCPSLELPVGSSPHELHVCVLWFTEKVLWV